MKIQSESEYTTTLERIDKLMDAPPNTPESAELERLVTAVEQYEEVHYPIHAPAKPKR